MKILSTSYYDEFPIWTLPDWAVEELRTNFPDFEIVKLTSRDRLFDELPETDILFAWAVREDQIRAAKRLKWIHTGMAGLNWILIPTVVNSDILVSSSKGVHAIPIAEHTISLMLAFSRRLVDCVDAQRQGIWNRREIWGRTASFDELYGKVVGIFGLGALGVEIGRRARAFGMRVVGFKRNPDVKPDVAEAVYAPSMLDEILPSLDYLVIASPLTPETRNRIGRRQLDLMKASAFIVNVARGEIIDQEALVHALNSGRIAGAGLDVFVPDPLPDGHPLFSTRNLILTPHTSGVSHMLWRRVMDIWIENIRRFLNGRDLINQVDKTRGY
jgi:phosphoglycerate dehydrogenase-like enzyme